MLFENLNKQIEFLLEIDKVKLIFRRSKLFDNSRFENDAEHSWHLAIMALILSEYANETVDIGKVIKMVLIHDIVEIDAGDYIAYTEQRLEKELKESEAAKRIFGILPEQQEIEFINLWNEFEERNSPEAKFAAALDRLEPIMQNYYTQAYTWHTSNISANQILSFNKKIQDGSVILWEYAKGLIEECINQGLIT